MEDMFSFFQDFENFDAQHYIETVKRLFYTDDIFRSTIFLLLFLIILLVVIIVVYKIRE